MPQGRASFVGHVAVEEYGGRGRVLAEIVGGLVQHVDVALLEHEPSLGENDGRRDQTGARQGAVFFTRIFEARHRARYRHGKVAAGAQVRNHVAGRIEEHRGSGSPRRGLAKVDECLTAVGELQRHETSAAEIACRRIDDCERITHRDSGIDRIAAIPQDVDSDPCREFLRGDDHAVLRGNGGGGGGVDRAGSQHSGRDEQRGAR